MLFLTTTANPSSSTSCFFSSASSTAYSLYAISGINFIMSGGSFLILSVSLYFSAIVYPKAITYKSVAEREEKSPVFLAKLFTFFNSNKYQIFMRFQMVPYLQFQMTNFHIFIMLFYMN